jgi:hypothetical protein
MFKVIYLVDGINVDYNWFENFKLAVEFASTLDEKNILEIKRYDYYVGDV